MAIRSYTGAEVLAAAGIASALAGVAGAGLGHMAQAEAAQRQKDAIKEQRDKELKVARREASARSARQRATLAALGVGTDNPNSVALFRDQASSDQQTEQNIRDSAEFALGGVLEPSPFGTIMQAGQSLASVGGNKAAMALLS